MNEPLFGLGFFKKLFKFILVKLYQGEIKPYVLDFCFFLLLLQIKLLHPVQNWNVPPNLQMMTLALRPCPWIGEIRILRNKNNWILYSSIHAYMLDVLWCQPIKLIQVVSTSEFHEYWWKDVDFIFFRPPRLLQGLRSNNIK